MVPPVALRLPVPPLEKLPMLVQMLRWRCLAPGRLQGRISKRRLMLMVQQLATSEVWLCLQDLTSARDVATGFM